ncbi:MAG: GNAT family N-acetyltransferase [Sphingomonadales bacterium]|jgi:N-acetylglutamate synthase-like GNAT family acetyltransferase
MVDIKPSVTIRLASDEDAPAIAHLIHSIQVDEFAVPISLEDQPDIGVIEAIYIETGGTFHVAEAEGQIIGSIGLEDLGGGNAALRKLYVAKDFRGRGLGLAHKLLALVLEHAAKKDISHIYLGVAQEFASARRFYEKSGFHLVGEEALPVNFPKTVVDKYFYRFSLGY